MPNDAGQVRTLLVPEDRFGNPGRLQRPALCQLIWEGAAADMDLRSTVEVLLPAPAGVGRAVLSVPMDSLAPEENVANGLRSGGRLLVTGNPVWPAEQGLRAVFGEFHWHTGYSGDGQRPISAALAAARDDLNLDFAAPGDHNPTPEQWQGTVPRWMPPTAQGIRPYGWENGTDRGPNDFTMPDHPGSGVARIAGGRRCPGGKPRGYPDFIAVPHHTNAVRDAASR